MKQSTSWQEELLSQGPGLGPWAFMEGIEKRLRKEIPRTRFVKQIKNELDALQLPLKLKHRTMEWLYELVLRARVEQETVAFAGKLFPKKAAGTGKNQLLSLLEGLQNASHIKNDAKSARAAKRLTKSLRKAIYVDKLWRQYAHWGTFRPDLKNLVVRVERHLRRKHFKRLKFKYQRAIVIAAMLTAMGLKKADFDEEALSRMLRPSRLKM